MNPEQHRDTGGEGAKRRVLLLQGPSSPFFAMVGQALRARGAEVARIGFCPGDRLYWKRASGTYLPYRGTPNGFARYLATYLESRGPTDILMLGDGRFYHRTAIDVARKANPAPDIWIVEQGYLRPDLILMEPNGTGGRSEIPARFAARTATPCPREPSPPFQASFLRYAALDVAYHMSNVLFGPVSYPHYLHHAIYSPAEEYAGWLWKGLTARSRARASRQALRHITEHHGEVFLFPLQLKTDFQLRDHGTGQELEEIVEDVIASFATHARKSAMLLLKTHPLDNARVNWRSLACRIAERHGVADRIAVIDRGRLDPLFDRLGGVITVNSTVGLTALSRGIPCHVLGHAIYDLPGLATHGDPAEFWRQPARPNPGLCEEFISFLRHFYHVPGAFDGAGAKIGASNLANRLAGRTQ